MFTHGEYTLAATKQDCEDFQFIISESIRLQRLLNESYDLYAKDFDDVYGPLFSTIDIPKDVYEQDKSQQRFQIHLSSKAQIKLLDITKRQIKQNNWLYELTVDEYIDDIKDSIYREFSRASAMAEASITPKCWASTSS